MTSIIVVTHNRISHIKDCLDSILSQKNVEKEIIVIDNASGDKTCDMIKKTYGDAVKLIRLDTDKNLVYCKRLGFKNSCGDIVAFTDDDCIVDDNWLANINKNLESPDCDIIAGPVRALKNIKYPWWWRRSLNWTIGIAEIGCPDFMPLGCNVSFKRHVLDDIMSEEKSLKEAQDIVYTEDTIRIKKAIDRGYKIKLGDSIVVYHNIDPKKLSFKYLIHRSWLEGRHWAKNEKKIKVLLTRVLTILINPLRSLITLNIHYLLRWVVSLSYIKNFFI